MKLGFFGCFVLFFLNHEVYDNNPYFGMLSLLTLVEKKQQEGQVLEIHEAFREGNKSSLLAISSGFFFFFALLSFLSS